MSKRIKIFIGIGIGIVLVLAGIMSLYLTGNINKIKNLQLPQLVTQKYQELINDTKYKKHHVISIELCTKESDSMYVVTGGGGPYNEFYYFDLKGSPISQFLTIDRGQEAPETIGQGIPLLPYNCNRLINDEKGITNSW